MGKIRDILNILKQNKEQENRCPHCNYLLSKNLKGKVEIKCKKCKKIITLNEK